MTNAGALRGKMVLRAAAFMWDNFLENEEIPGHKLGRICYIRLTPQPETRKCRRRRSVLAKRRPVLRAPGGGARGTGQMLLGASYFPAAAFSPAILPYTMHMPQERPFSEMGYCTAKRPPWVAPAAYRPGMSSRSVLYTWQSSSDSRPPRLPRVRAHPHSAA